MQRLYIGVALILLSLTGCYDDDTVQVITQTQMDPIILDPYTPDIALVETDVTGLIVDENNKPISGVKIQVGDVELETDNYGHFFMRNQSLNAYGTLATADKPGYFQGSRRFFPLEKTENTIKIMLLQKEYNYSFDAITGGTVELSEGGSIVFAPESIEAGEDSPYTGVVRVAARWLDPTQLETLEQMPGALQGVGLSTEFNEAQLGTYGMMQVELSGDQGEELNIAEGATASLRMPIPESILDQAPTTIPLWSFNDRYGIWAEESWAIKQGDEYVGDVEHFSTWNCDKILEHTRRVITFKDKDGQPLADAHITVKAFDSFVGTIRTNAQGKARYNVPNDVELTFTMIDPCGAVVSSQPYGPFNETDTELSLEIDASTIKNIKLKGTLSCVDDPVENGLIILDYGEGESYHYLNDDRFEFNIYTCRNLNEVSLTALNLDDATKNKLLSFQIEESVDLGIIDICPDDVEDFFFIEVEGDFNYFDPPQVLINRDLAQTLIFAIGVRGSLSMSFSGLEAGDYSGEGNNVLTYARQADKKWKFDRSFFDSFTITQFNNSIRGEFSGQLINRYDGQVILQDVSGAFKVTR